MFSVGNVQTYAGKWQHPAPPPTSITHAANAAALYVTADIKRHCTSTVTVIRLQRGGLEPTGRR